MSAAKGDYIPQNIDAFHKWFKHLDEYITAKTEGSSPAWHHIPPDELEEFHAVFYKWQEVYEELLTSDSTKAPQKRTFAKKEAVEFLRPFVKRHLQYKAVTDAERVEMGIPVHDSTRTPLEQPEEQIAFVMVSEGPRILSFLFRILGAEGRARPHSADGAVFAWALLDKEPESLSELVNRSPVTRSPLKLTFTDEDRGKKLYAAAAWKNVLGEGPWSNIQFTYVP
ncbi:MAG: hypothetical protein FWB99_00045 [Treponema sp.]|nr:hypothetical protein [Treponema sp.]